MRKSSVVIGAGYGDEGKGVVTSTLAKSHDLIVRFCGGSQAAHTVEYKKTRHVFHHFGSGTLQNKPTYLTKDFIINPIMFMRELKDLNKIGIEPKIYMHPNCRITTPFDMLINQNLEIARGDKKHGSCGLGINETVERHNRPDLFKLLLHSASTYIDNLKHILSDMFNSYYKKRATMLELDIKIFNDIDLVESILDRYVTDLIAMLSNTEIIDNSIFNNYDNVLFEGSQGLLLDEYYGQFPHVTRARTGLNNVMPIINKYMGINLPDVYYVTRHYVTRHGAGPLKHEFKSDGEIIDKTNIHNEWQGSIRFGFLDINDLKNIINRDRENRFRNHLVVTCMDQKINFVNKTHNLFIDENGIIKTLHTKKYLKMLSDYINMPVHYTDGPKTRSKLKNT